jgi:hypothetical protein
MGVDNFDVISVSIFEAEASVTVRRSGCCIGRCDLRRGPQIFDAGRIGKYDKPSLGLTVESLEFLHPLAIAKSSRASAGVVSIWHCLAGCHLIAGRGLGEQPDRRIPGEEGNGDPNRNPTNDPGPGV